MEQTIGADQLNGYGKLTELQCSKGCDQQHKVQLLASHYCCTTGMVPGQYCLTSSLITWMMGHGAPSTNFQEIEDWEEGLMT